MQNQEYIDAVQTIGQALSAAENAFKAQYPDTYAQLIDSDKYMIGRALGERLKVAGHVGIDDVQKVIEHFEKYGEAFGVSGKLSFQMRVQQSPAANSMPHADEPALKKITNLEVATKKETVKMFLQNPAMLQKFNDRLAWLQRTGRHRDEAAATEHSKSVAQDDGEYAEARARVGALKISDISNTNSGPGGGRWAQLQKVQDRLNRAIDVARQRREKVLEYVKGEIAKLQSSSIN